MAKLPHREAALMRSSGGHPRYLDSEWQANAFAAAMLMPAEGLASLQGSDHKLDELLLMRRFNVSAQAAQIRINVFNSGRL
jgi:Zn-dependent peptidase ImmA (M78 family)